VPTSDPEASPGLESSADASVAAAPHVIATRTEPQAIVPTTIPAPLEPETLVQRTKADELLRAYAGTPTPAPARELQGASFVWGLAQPLLGLRVLVRHQDLLVRATLPVLGFVAVCLLVAEGGGGFLSWIGAYYLTLIGAAPLSPILFARNYARLAAEARPHLGLAPREPYLRTFRQSIVEAIVQLIVLGAGVAPLVGLATLIPWVGPIWAAVIGWGWALHWVVVEALDSARTLPATPGEQDFAERHAEFPELDLPWFALPQRWQLRGPAGAITAPLRWWAKWLGRLGAHWRGEIAIIEKRPWVAAGFALGSALLLAIPVLNLLFRPAIVIAASHVLGWLEDEPEGEHEHEGEPNERAALSA